MQVGDVEAADALAPERVLVADVAAVAPGPLVAAGAEGLGALAGEDDDADVGVLPGQLERPRQLDDRVGPEGVAHLGPVDRDLGDPHVVAVEHRGRLVADVVPLAAGLPHHGHGRRRYRLARPPGPSSSDDDPIGPVEHLGSVADDESGARNHPRRRGTTAGPRSRRRAALDRSSTTSSSGRRTSARAAAGALDLPARQPQAPRPDQGAGTVGHAAQGPRRGT